VRPLFFLLCTPLLTWALEFTIASYNVENLFDAHKEGNEYKEYTPGNQHGWDEAMLAKKITNLARVINDIDADVIALVEVENHAVLERLNRALKKPYAHLFYPNKKPRVNIETALLSRFPIVKSSSLFMKDQARGIHRVELSIQAHTLILYLNHWPAHKEKEDERLVYATTLHNALLKDKEKEVVLVGDFNSPLQIKSEEWGVAFHHVLKAASGEGELKNLWLELPQKERYSHTYGKSRSALDHIVVSKRLEDGKGIEYRPKSFQTFKTSYLFNEEGIPKRWQISDRGRGKHLGEGFSDHLPLRATFHIHSD